MAYDDFSVAFGGGIPDEEEDQFAVPVAGMPGASDYAAITSGLANNAKRAALIRQQQLERATQTLQQRPSGQTLSERLLRLSAAFAQPSRTRGFAGVLGNVVPELADQMAVRRVGSQKQADALRELQDRYAMEDVSGERESLRDQLKVLEAQMRANKPKRPQILSDGMGRFAKVNEDGTLSEAPVAASGAGLPQPKTPQEAAMLPPGTEFMTPDGRVMRVPGGPTGSTPSGNFPTGNPLDRRSITGF